MAAATLVFTLAVVYLASGLTLPRGHGMLAGAELLLGSAQLLASAAVASGPRRRADHAVVALELALTALWLLSRTAGLPGQGRLPVGELDVICLLDQLIAVALLVTLPARRRASSLLPIQVAIAMAGITLFAWGGGHAHAAPARGATFAGAGGQLRFYCHLL